MSFGNTNRPEEIPSNTYLNSDQVAMLMAMDPNYKDKFEVQQNIDNQQQYDALASRSDAFDMRQAPKNKLLDIKGVQSEGSGSVKGGFAFLPLLGALAPTLIDIVGKLFGGKGSEVVNSYFNDNQELLKNSENQLSQIKHPHQFFRLYKTLARDIAHPLIAAGSGQSPEFARVASEKFARSLFPKLFNEIISRESKKEGSGIGRAVTNADLAEPISKYVLMKLTGSQNMAKKIMGQIKPNLRLGAGIYASGGFNWGSIFNIVKKVADVAIPLIQSDSGKQIIGKVANAGVDALINKFKPAQGSGILSQMLPPPFNGIAGMMGFGANEPLELDENGVPIYPIYDGTNVRRRDAEDATQQTHGQIRGVPEYDPHTGKVKLQGGMINPYWKQQQGGKKGKYRVRLL